MFMFAMISPLQRDFNLASFFYFNTIEHYEPVRAKWTTERCAVCRWVEDWDFNKIIICIRYFSSLP